MSDYIKREDAISTMYEFLKQANDISGRNNEKLAEVLVIAKNVIYTIPLADVAPVRHGRWAKDSDGCLFCSICENTAELNPLSGEQMKTRYCNNCGAKMDGDEDV